MKQRIGHERVRARIKEIAADSLQHKISDPRKGFMTVTKVDLAHDFRFAKIHVSVMGDESEKSRCMHMLESAASMVQRRVAKALKTRVAPQLSFVLDDSIEKSIRMDSIFDRIAQERQEREAEELDESEEEADESAEEHADRPADSSADEPADESADEPADKT